MIPRGAWRPGGANDRLRDAFLHWQCRIRQIAMRADAGRPSPGMVPEALTLDGQSIGRIITVLPQQSRESTTGELRHMARRTHDPAERRRDALAFFSERYYQLPLEFADTLTATFAAESAIASRLVGLGECRLRFDQFAQAFDVVCSVSVLPPDNPLREATYWHNFLFNPDLPADCAVLGFEPNWPRSEARPTSR